MDQGDKKKYVDLNTINKLDLMDTYGFLYTAMYQATIRFPTNTKRIDIYVDHIFFCNYIEKKCDNPTHSYLWELKNSK